MLRFHTLQYRSSHFILFVLFLLLLGPVQSSWCFQDGDVTVIPDKLLRDCHLVPSTCLTSSGMFIEQTDGTLPTNCDACLDLTFEDVALTVLQDQASALTFTAEIAHFQPPSMVLLESARTRLILSQEKHRFLEDLKLHRSIQSTRLII
jgi:hypothetical protein